MKKMMAVLLCLCMAVSLAAPAFATAGTDAALLADVLAAVEIAEKADVLLTEEDTGVPMDTPVDEGDGNDPVKDDGTGLGDETVKDREDSTDEGGDEGGSGGEEEPAFTVPASGSLTETITWAVDENYVLTITGTGAMPDYEHSSKTPWANARLKLTAIHIGEGITHVGNYAFDWCSNVTETTLPDTLVSIGEWALGNGATGTTIDLPIGLKSIDKNAFHLNRLTSVTLPVGLESVGESAFAGGSIEDVTIPAGVELGIGVFGSNPVKILTLEEGCTALPAVNVFNSNNGITVLHLPSTIETLDGEFIDKVTALETVTVAPDADASHFFVGWRDEDGYMFTSEELADGADHTGDLTAVWSAYSGTIEGTDITWSFNKETGTLTLTGTGDIPDNPWHPLRHLITSIEISEGITGINDSIFAGCQNVVSVKLPSTLHSIGNSAFWECVKLESIDLPDGLVTLGSAFSDCRALTEITIPGSVKTLNAIFLKCTALKTITIEEGVTALPGFFAVDCSALETVNLPSTIETIGMGSFAGCPALESITMAKDADGNSLTCWVDENGNTYSTNDLISGVDGTLTAFWGIFADVAATDWFYDYVMYCYDEGIMNGVGDGAFDPYGGATRAQVVTVLYRLAGEPTGAADSTFSDIPAGQWFTEAVNWAAANGIAKGYEDGTFAPYNYVTREEFLVFLDRFSESKKLRLNKWSELYDLSECGVSDADSISDWALESETWSYIIGLQTGYDNGDETYSLNPRSYITRAELATFQSRYASNLVLFVYAESCQYMVGYPPSVAVNAFKTEPDEKLEVEEDLEAWCFYDKGVALLVDYSESSKGKIVDWAYTGQL